MLCNDFTPDLFCRHKLAYARKRPMRSHMQSFVHTAYTILKLGDIEAVLKILEAKGGTCQFDQI